jgi:hypothetical protein
MGIGRGGDSWEEKGRRKRKRKSEREKKKGRRGEVYRAEGQFSGCPAASSVRDSLTWQ